MKYELSDEEVKVLYTFLNRVNLSGSEVPAFNKIIEIFSNTKDEEKKK